MGNLEHLNFSDHEMDEFILKWLSKGLNAEEQEKWNSVLMYNKKFREHLCEWLKSMRDPAWARKHFYIKKAQ